MMYRLILFIYLTNNWSKGSQEIYMQTRCFSQILHLCNNGNTCNPDIRPIACTDSDCYSWPDEKLNLHVNFTLTCSQQDEYVEIISIRYKIPAKWRECCESNNLQCPDSSSDKCNIEDCCTYTNDKVQNMCEVEEKIKDEWQNSCRDRFDGICELSIPRKLLSEDCNSQIDYVKDPNLPNHDYSWRYSRLVEITYQCVPNGIPSSTDYPHTDEHPHKVYAKLGDSVSFECNHGLQHEMLVQVTKVDWWYNNMEEPIVLLSGRNAENDQFKDRLTMDDARGNLSISSVTVSDAGMFHCFLILATGETQDAHETYDLEIVEVPKMITISCTGIDGIKMKSCDDIKYSEVSSIRCSVSSRPNVKVHWNEKPNCSTQKSKEIIEVEDGISTYTTILFGVCNGTYQCISTYINGPYKEKVESKMVILNKIIDTDTTPSTDTPYTGLTVGISVTVITLCVVILIAVGVLVYKRNWGPKFLYRMLPRNSSNDTPEKLTNEKEKDINAGDKLIKNESE